MTEDEVLAYLVAKSAASRRADGSPELLVNMHEGEREFYRDRDDRNLRYTVDRSHFLPAKTTALS